MNETIEKKAAEAILQEPETIDIKGKKYEVAPPCVATLIKVSELVSLLPRMEFQDEQVIEGVLANAKHCKVIGDIASVLILGVRGLTRKVQVPVRRERRFLWFTIHRTFMEEKTIDRKAELSNELMETLSPTEMLNVVTRVLQRMQVADFFALTTFLNGINLMSPTRKVGI